MQNPDKFVIVIIEEDGERVPLTIAGINPEQETITLVIQAVGYSTKKLAQFNVGDNIPHILGPLGEPAPLEGYKKSSCCWRWCWNCTIISTSKVFKRKWSNHI